MRRYFVLISLTLFSFGTFAAGFSINSGNGFLYPINAPNINGNVFIFSDDTSNISIKLSADKSAAYFSWFQYKSNPADAVELTKNIVSDEKTSTLDSIKGNSGYYVEYGDENCRETNTCLRRYMWIALYDAPVDSVTLLETDCENMRLRVHPPYRKEYVLADTSGARKTGLIERELKIEYYTWGRPGVEVDTTITGHYYDVITFTVPYIDTEEVVVTDIFAGKLKLDVTPDTVSYVTSAVIAFPTMSVADKADNELKVEGETWEADDNGNVVVEFSESLDIESMLKFKTSGPLYIDFVSNASPKTVRYEWHFSRNPSFANDFVYFEKDLNRFAFRDTGAHFVKLMIFSNIGTPDEVCTHTSFACFKISDSVIFVPNVFTPQGAKNNKFKVAYRSIASYRCRVYNQWGKKVYDSTDITDGWDGKIGGSYAPVGAYFYIIDAKGIDGDEIKKRGDINLLRSK